MDDNFLSEESVKDFVEKNEDYYVKAFTKVKNNKFSFNGAAGFLNIAWFAYRKMYGWMVIALILNRIRTNFVFRIANINERVFADIASFIVFLIVYGLLGNIAYYGKYQRLFHNEKEDLKKYGGTSEVSVVLLFAGLVILAYIKETYYYY